MLPVRLDLTLDCDVDAAWALIRSPDAMAATYGALMTIEPVDGRPFPATWPVGETALRMRLLGRISLGARTLQLAVEERRGARILVDTGRGLTGTQAIFTRWRHRMAVSPLPDGRTRYRDQLEFAAGGAEWLLWPGLWFGWQLRGLVIRRLAREA